MFVAILPCTRIRRVQSSHCARKFYLSQANSNRINLLMLRLNQWMQSMLHPVALTVEHVSSWKERRNQVVRDAVDRTGNLSGASANCTLVQQAESSIAGFAKNFHVICSWSSLTLHMDKKASSPELDSWHIEEKLEPRNSWICVRNSVKMNRKNSSLQLRAQ